MAVMPEVCIDVVDGKTTTELASFLAELAGAKPKESDITRQVYEWALELDRTNAKAWNGLGRCHLALKEWERAGECFLQATTHDSEDARFCINLAVAFDHLGNLERAEHWCDVAIDRDPKCVSAYLELFSIYEQQELPESAYAAVWGGLQIDPAHHDLLFARACLELKQGNFEQGWKDYEHRPSRINLANPMDEYPEWNGEPLQGKTIMVVREQGLGDEIMFSRYLPLLHDLGANVVIYAYAELARLFARAFPWARIVTSDAEASTVQMDYWVGTSSLPLKLYAGPKHDWRSGIERDPNGFWDRPQYLYADNLRECSNETSAFRVGLCWKGNPKHARDEFRSMGFENLTPLLGVPGVEFVSLQMHDAESGLPNLRDLCHDWADVADQMADVDLIISVDTGMAHLAGALGKPVWVLISTLSDWRWGTEGTQTPWYPSMQLYRQMDTGDWRSVVERVKHQLIHSLLPGRTSAETEVVALLHQQAPAAFSQTAQFENAGLHAAIVTRDCRYGPMTFYPTDQWLGRSLELYGEWSEGEVELFRHLLKPGDVVVEAGANIGAHTVALAEIVGIEGAVWAFEPQPTVFPVLHENVIRNCAGVRMVKRALGADFREVVMEAFDAHNPGGCAIADSAYPITEQPPSGAPVVEQNPLDYYHLGRLDFLKADCEGHELDVLKGAEATIARCRPLIYAENDREGSTQTLSLWLTEHNYRLYQHKIPLYNPNNSRGNPVNVFGGIVSAMILAVPTERKDLRLDTLGNGLDRIRWRTT